MEKYKKKAGEKKPLS